MQTNFDGNLRRAIGIIIFICASFLPLGAQTLMEQLFHIKNLISDDRNAEALRQLNVIEGACLNSDNDTVKVLFNESKGSILFSEGQYEQSIPYMKKVPALYEAIGIREIGYIEAFLALGISNRRSGHMKEAENAFRRGLIRSSSVRNGNDYQSSFYLQLGTLYRETGDSTLASECFKHVDSEANGDLINNQVLELLNEGELEAIRLREKGQYEQSIPVYDGLIKTAKEILGIHNEDYARLVFSKALVLHYNLGRSVEAMPLFEEVIALKNYIGDCNEDVLGSMMYRLQILANQGKTEAVNNDFPEARIAFNNCNNGHNTEGMLNRIVGNGYYAARNFGEAIPFYERYLELTPEEDGTSSIEIPNMLAVSYIFCNKPENAEDILVKLIETRVELLDANEDVKCQVLHNLGRAIMLQQRPLEALKYFDESTELSKKIYGQENPRTKQYIEECKSGL